MDKERADGKERILERIRSLLAMTVENGCTEEEALSAAAMASKLLDKYDLDMSDLGTKKDTDDYAPVRTPASDDVGQRMWRPASAIGKLTGTRYYRVETDIVFFGRPSDVEIAMYLLKICERATRDCAERFDRGTVLLRTSLRKGKRGAFLDGMADSLTAKLLAIHEARRGSSAGRELVLSKQSMVDDAMKRQDIFISSRKRHSGRDFDPSYHRGKEAGDTVAFNDGLRGETGRSGTIEENVPA